jgi:hypothetical protein
MSVKENRSATVIPDARWILISFILSVSNLGGRAADRSSPGEACSDDRATQPAITVAAPKRSITHGTYGK